MNFEIENFKIGNVEDEELAVVLRKANAILENLQFIENYNEEVGKYNEYTVNKISIDFDNQYDEFYLDCNIPNGVWEWDKRKGIKSSYTEEERKAETSIAIEVLSAEGAKESDMDFIDNNEDYEDEEYELGGNLSIYRKLGNSEFYYRLL